MLHRMTVLAALTAGVLGLATTAGVAQPDKKAGAEDQAKVKEALQKVQDFIGEWNLEGTQKVGAKTEAWKEKVNWGWKFKDGNPSLVVNFGGGKGKYYKDGELNYDVAGKKYLLTLTPATGKAEKQTFEGTYAKGALKVERKDKAGDTHRITLNTLAEGEKLKVRVEKTDGGKIFSEVFAMNGQKEGLVAGGPKKPECVVSGGAATIEVSYNGKKYFVCCSGCRDEFNADPKKYAK